MIIKSKIGEKCTVGDGAHASLKRVEVGIPYLSSKNFKKEGLDLSVLSYIEDNDFERHFRENSKALTRPKYGDIIIGIIGSIGAPYIVTENDKFGISSSVAIVRPGSELDSTYLFYYLKTQAVQDYVEAIKSGAAQGFLSLEMIKSIPLLYPTYNEQLSLSTILKNFDDKIDINNKRISVLEDTARELYKEWFVRMRFPGYEKTKINKGIPEGWGFIKLGAVSELISRGISPSYDENGGSVASVK